MKTVDLIDLIDEHLQEANSDTKDRIDKIKTILDFLNYNLRLTELSDDEKQDFMGCIEGYPLTDEMRETLDNCKTEERKNYYYTMWARSTYFKRCAWMQYLCGETDDKPFKKTEDKIS